MSSTTARLADPALLAARRALLDRPDMVPLRDYAAAIRTAAGATPDFDPADGGVAARLLILLETPGPTIGRTGFVSADNPTGTAANLRRFLAGARIDRRDIAVWNTVPFVIHAGGPNRPPRITEIRRGLAWLPALLPLLPQLQCVVLAGRVAGLAEPVIRAENSGLAIIRIPHPSPVYVCTSLDIPRRIAAGLQDAGEAIAHRKTCAAHNFACTPATAVVPSKL